MLTLDKIEPQTVAVFGPDGTCLGHANEYGSLETFTIPIRRSGGEYFTAELSGKVQILIDESIVTPRKYLMVYTQMMTPIKSPLSGSFE